MKDFTYYNPTALHFGRGKEAEVGRIIQKYHFKHVLLHYGQGSSERNGLLARVRQALSEAGIEFIEIGGVQPNPEINLVRSAVAQIKGKPLDLILAVGGGSVIDSAKLIAHGYFYQGDPFDFSIHKVEPQTALPVGVILTLSAAGSEMSTSCVISDESQQIKIGFNAPTNRPLFVIENPELSFSVPAEQTAAGIADMMMHTMERFFNASEANEISDGLALGLLKSIKEAGLIAMKNPHDYQARANLMLGSSLAHNGLTSLGKSSHMPVHLLEHALGGLFPRVTHGTGLAVLFPAWAEYYLTFDTAKFAQFGRGVFEVTATDDVLAAKEGITALRAFYAQLGLPSSLTAFGVQKSDLIRIADHLFKDRMSIHHHVSSLDKAGALKILAAAF